MRTPDHEKLIEAYLADLADRRYSPRTITTYAGVLARAHAELPHGLAIACRDELAAWLTSGRSGRTQAAYTACLRSFYRWAMRRGYLDFNPAADLDRPRIGKRRIPPATDTQVRTILDRSHGWLQLASRIAAYTGARAIEVDRLHREHITADRAILDGKGSREREVPTHEHLWQAVKELPPGPLVPGTLPGPPLPPDRVKDGRMLSRRCWWHYRHHLGVPIGMHRLRAWYADTLWRSGVDLEIIRQLLGHSTLTTTQAYLGVTSATRLREAVAVLPTWEPAA